MRSAPSSPLPSMPTPITASTPSPADRSDQKSDRIRIDALRGHEHGGSSLVTHRRVVAVPVVMRPASSREDLTEQNSQTVGVHVRTRIIGTDQLRGPLHGHPLPSAPDRDGDGGVGPQQGKL